MSKKDRIWNKARKIKGEDPKRYRMDKTGRKIRYSSYGLYTATGWVLDHIVSKYDGGSDDDCNLQALQTRQNLLKGRDSWENNCEPDNSLFWIGAGVIGGWCLANYLERQRLRRAKFLL